MRLWLVIDSETFGLKGAFQMEGAIFRPEDGVCKIITRKTMGNPDNYFLRHDIAPNNNQGFNSVNEAVDSRSAGNSMRHSQPSTSYNLIK